MCFIARSFSLVYSLHCLFFCTPPTPPSLSIRTEMKRFRTKERTNLCVCTCLCLGEPDLCWKVWREQQSFDDPNNSSNNSNGALVDLSMTDTPWPLQCPSRDVDLVRPLSLHRDLVPLLQVLTALCGVSNKSFLCDLETYVSTSGARAIRGEIGLLPTLADPKSTRCARMVVAHLKSLCVGAMPPPAYYQNQESHHQSQRHEAVAQTITLVRPYEFQDYTDRKSVV